MLQQMHEVVEQRRLGVQALNDEPAEVLCRNFVRRAKLQTPINRIHNTKLHTTSCANTVTLLPYHEFFLKPGNI